MLADYTVRYTGLGKSVHIHRDLWLLWQSHRQIKLDALETAGVLIGLSSMNKKNIWIHSSTTATSLDERSRYFFKLTDTFHQSKVNKAHDQSNGALIYMGTWHTHPQTIPTPSHVDLDDWKDCVQRNPRRPLVFVIVGTDEVRLYAKWGNRFKTLKQVESTIDDRQ